jgi:SpoVK/Ycf46/Vps4 family AAA+-type ATPase
MGGLTELKLSIRLGDLFPKATLVEVNANAMLSKYFGESGKLIESTFDQVEAMAKDRSKLVVVVIDEVETIASSRQRVSSSGECNDGLRVSGP